LRTVFGICVFAAAIGAEQPTPVPPTDLGMDAAVVKGGEFESTGFKFHYELPKGWKALDDAKRVAANQQLRDQYAHPVHNPNMPASKKKPQVQKTMDATINSPKERALVLESLGQVLLPTTLVPLAGREFARVEVLHAGGPYHSLWVTEVGDYLIGFDVRSSSDSEMQALLETLRSVRFD
jgi:hypothetical protein